jgi:predicted transcriptional regulator
MVNESESLSRREREMMDVIYRLGEATAAQVREGLAEPPSDSAVRTILRILEGKGHLTHRRESNRFVFSPTTPPGKARRSALRRVVDTFFADEPEEAFEALLDVSGRDLSEKELDRLSALIDKARKEGR